MTAHRSALLLAALLGLGACASDHEMTAASNCHASDGQFVNAPNCTITYGWSQTTATTTTTTVVTEETNAPSSKPATEPKDER